MKRKFKRYIAAILASVMLFTDCVSGFAAEVDTTTELNEIEIMEENAQPEKRQVLFELENLREQSVKQYRLSDGTILAAQYGMDVHYEDESGKWAEIDNRFLYETAKNAEDFAGYKSAQGAVKFKFAPQVQEGELVKITKDEYSVGFELLPSATVETYSLRENEESEENITELSPAPISFLQGEVLNAEEVPAEFAVMPVTLSLEEEAEVVWADVSPETPAVEEAELFEGLRVEDAVTSVGYGNVFPGVSLQYVLSGSSLKEYILVNQKSDSYSYDFAMNLGNLEPQMQEDGSIILKDVESGTIIYEIPAGYMTDAAGEFSDAVTMSVAESEDGDWILNVIADEAWINAEERVFPVQIDPTLVNVMKSEDEICGTYAEQFDVDGLANTQYGNMMVGYDSYKTKKNRAYIQLKNLPQLPKESVICGAVSYFYVMDFSGENPSFLDIAARKVTGDTTWKQPFFWDSQPTTETLIMDYHSVSKDKEGTYIGWNITELVKEHYLEGNAQDSVSAFMLIACNEDELKDSYCAKAALRLTNTNSYPMLQIIYRDTKGIEDYYTYQTHDIGNAGTAYVGDYNGQLTLVRPVAVYDSTIMSYNLSLVYNSSCSDRYFTNDGVNVHSKNFSTTKIGHGWKLSAQETIAEIELADGDNNVLWLVYNDSDGTEHYFKQSEGTTNVYVDEDGLNLTITKTGADFVMTDLQDNKKYFTKGYLTKITDANGNAIHIVYNGGTAASNNISATGANRITSVYSQPNGGVAEKIFMLTYDVNNLLTTITEIHGNSYEIGYITGTGGEYLLKRISNYDSENEKYVENTRYGYGASNYVLQYVFDSDAGRGMQYEYEESMTGRRIKRFLEYAEGNVTGSIVLVDFEDLRKTVYRDYGTDRIQNEADDIFTTYFFNSSGQTVNVHSTDTDGNLLGVSAADYEANSGTSGKNNRISNTIAGGQAGVNLLLNSSFEKYTTAGTISTANHWIHLLSGGSASCRTTNPRSGEEHYNIYSGNTNQKQIIYQTVDLEVGKTYTASAYVNTSGVAQMNNGGGAYLMFADEEGEPLADGIMLQYKTDANIDNGWQRISVTYTPSSSKQYRICVVWKNIQGTVRVDDVQLEQGEAPSSYNHVYNGSFENGEEGWTFSQEDKESVKTAEAIHGNKAFCTEGYPDTELYAKQQISLNKSGASTFLLSGWSKGASVPDLDAVCEDGTERFWGITVKLVYTDGTDETHYLTFNEFVKEWQYAAMAVVPEKADATIDYAEIRLHYNNNANTAYFDNISLTEEPAQAYQYNTNGNVTEANAAGSEGETYTYDSEENLTKIETEDSGDYDLAYENEDNGHLPTTVVNGTLTTNITYDSYGQSTKTVQSNSVNQWKVTTSSQYGNGLLLSEKDDTNEETTYTYNSKRQLEKVQKANGQAISTFYDSVYGRPSTVYQSKRISVDYAYEGGNLIQIQRGAYETIGGTKKFQTYSFGYDLFGNLASVAVGNNRLSGYTYNLGNGTLENINYGAESAPLATISYGYDKLDRLKNVTYHDTNTGQSKTYGYRYSADGNLSGVTEGNELKYTYEYDSKGRLIYSNQLDEGNTVLYTKHQYDTSDRIASQSWQIGDETFKESYTYREEDGNVESMSIESSGSEAETIQYTYNGLQQPKKQITKNLDMTYTYRALDVDAKTVSNQIGKIQYLHPQTGAEVLPTLLYSFDSVGNITKIELGSEAAEYTYDDQNQVTKEVLPSQTSNYGYDTYGNIRSKAVTNSQGKSETYTFTYGNENWLDQLTKVSYKNEDGVTTTKTLTYDSIGNPLSYFNGKSDWEFDWKYGRELAEAENKSTGITSTYTYNENGIRESKTVGNTKHDYITLDDKVIRETYGSTTIDYFYDAQGRAYKIVADIEGTKYVGYFVLNQQGDTIALLGENGAVVVTYEYDAWGKEISHTATGTLGDKLYQYNALKYRGYYFDAESGFYYLQSRYYDPEIGRFISADTADILFEDEDNLLQHNLYTYCFNNPVNMVDLDGRLARYASKAAFYSGIALGGIVGTTLVIIGGILFVYYSGKLIKKVVEHFQEHRTTKNGSKTRLNDKHTKPRPGRQSEKKKQKSGWKRPR